MNARHANAVDTIRSCIATASGLPAASIGTDDDLVDDVGLDELELESLQLILEDVFSITVPDGLWKSPFNRTPSSLAEWCIRKSDEAAWEASRQDRRRA